MKVIQDLWLCEDCTMVACNDDSTGIDSSKREKEVRRAVKAMGNISLNNANTDNVEDNRKCDCCGVLGEGFFCRFAILGK